MLIMNTEFSGVTVIPAPSGRAIKQRGLGMKKDSGLIPRKRYLINKTFQMKFLFRIFLGVLLTSMLLSSMIFYLSRSGTTVVFRDFHLEVLTTSEFILSSLFISLAVSLIVSLVLYFVLGLIYSHHISGPMFRFERVFKNMAEGDLLQSVVLRHNDEWKATASSLEAALASLRDKMSHLNRAFRDLKNMEEVKNSPEISQKMDAVQKSIQQFHF